MIVIHIAYPLGSRDRETALILGDPGEERRADIDADICLQIFRIFRIRMHGHILLETVIKLCQQVFSEADQNRGRLCAVHTEGFLHMLGDAEALRRLDQRDLLIDGDLLHAVNTEVTNLIFFPFRALLRTDTDTVVKTIIPDHRKRVEDVLHAVMFEDLPFTEFVLDILESHRMLRSHGVPDRADGIDEVVIRRVMASDIVDLFGIEPVIED